MSDAEGKAILNMKCTICHKTKDGCVEIDHDTAEFAVETINKCWGMMESGIGGGSH